MTIDKHSSETARIVCASVYSKCATSAGIIWGSSTQRKR